MAKAIQIRVLQRLIHLIAAAILVAYVYFERALGSGFTSGVRWIALPTLVLSGIALWKWPKLRRLLRQRRIRA